jgi:putative Mn2+ efflux pump MntP
VLFAALLLVILGYTMVYSSLHGRWDFWRYFFPKTAPQGQEL